MINILTAIHITVCLFLVVIVLLQHGKGADMGATFGGSSQTVFGSEGPMPLLNKITTAAAVLFMLTSLSLAYLSANHGDDSVMTGVKPPAAEKTVTVPSVPPVTVPLPDANSDKKSDTPSPTRSEKKTQ